MSLEETKEKLDLSKHVFEYKKKNSYGIENRNDMTRIHDNEGKNISEYHLLNDIINTLKRAKKFNSHYSPILHRPIYKAFIVSLSSLRKLLGIVLRRIYLASFSGATLNDKIRVTKLK